VRSLVDIAILNTSASHPMAALKKGAVESLKFVLARIFASPAADKSQRMDSVLCDLFQGFEF